MSPPPHLPERALEHVSAPPPAAVAQRIAQLNQERVEVVGEAGGRLGEASSVELRDQPPTRRRPSAPSVASSSVPQ